MRSSPQSEDAKGVKAESSCPRPLECIVAAMQQASLEAGTDRLSMEEIDAEIQAVRRERRSRVLRAGTTGSQPQN